MSIRIDEVAPGLDSGRRRFHQATDEYFNLVNPQGCLMLDGKRYNSDKESNKESVEKVLRAAVDNIQSRIDKSKKKETLSELSSV